MKTALLILSLALLAACSRTPSLSCSDEEVKTVVLDIALDESAEGYSRKMYGPLHGPESVAKTKEELLATVLFSVENIRDQGRDKDTGACYCAATMKFTNSKNPNPVPTTLEITYTVEHIVDQPGEFMVTVEGL